MKTSLSGSKSSNIKRCSTVAGTLRVPWPTVAGTQSVPWQRANGTRSVPATLMVKEKLLGVQQRPEEVLVGPLFSRARLAGAGLSLRQECLGRLQFFRTRRAGVD